MACLVSVAGAEESSAAGGEADALQGEGGADASLDATNQCMAQHEQAQELKLDRRLIEARATLRACSRPACPSPIRVDCVTWLDAVENSIPSIVFAAQSERGDETRVKVFVDRELVTERLDGRAREMNPGAHEVRFELPPYPPVERSVVVREGQRNRVVAASFVAPAAPPPAPPVVVEEPVGIPTLAFVLGGVAVAGMATGTGVGVSALRLRSERLDSCAPLCAEEDERRLRTRALMADVGWAVGLLAAGGTALVWVGHARRRDAHSVTRGGLGPVGNGVGVRLQGELR